MLSAAYIVELKASACDNQAHAVLEYTMLRILIQFLDLLFNLAAGVFLLRLFFNEINPNPFSRVFALLHRITEPVLAPIRKILPLSLKDRLYIDISPIIVVILIIALKFLTIKIVSTVLLRLKG